MANFPVAGFVRTLRRMADLSQREMAHRCGLTRQAVAAMESRPELARVQSFEQLVRATGRHLVIVDSSGLVLEPDDEELRRDRGGRHYPAHLDVRPATEGWWGSAWPMFYGREPEFTFDRSRRARDRRRDHLRLLPALVEEMRQSEAGGHEPH